jgi:hypothetical protein
MLNDSRYTSLTRAGTKISWKLEKKATDRVAFTPPDKPGTACVLAASLLGEFKNTF